MAEPDTKITVVQSNELIGCAFVSLSALACGVVALVWCVVLPVIGVLYVGGWLK